MLFWDISCGLYTIFTDIVQRLMTTSTIHRLHIAYLHFAPFSWKSQANSVVLWFYEIVNSYYTQYSYIKWHIIYTYRLIADSQNRYSQIFRYAYIDCTHQCTTSVCCSYQPCMITLKFAVESKFYSQLASQSLASQLGLVY